jgi:hypothetical protein
MLKVVKTSPNSVFSGSQAGRQFLINFPANFFSLLHTPPMRRVVRGDGDSEDNSSQYCTSYLWIPYARLCSLPKINLEACCISKFYEFDE